MHSIWSLGSVCIDNGRVSLQVALSMPAGQQALQAVCCAERLRVPPALCGPAVSAYKVSAPACSHCRSP